MATSVAYPLKAIILAAGPGAGEGEPFFKVLASLGEQTIIEYVTSLVANFVAPDDITIVVIKV